MKSLEKAMLWTATAVSLALFGGFIRGGHDTFVLIAALMAVGGLLVLLLLAKLGLISIGDRD